MKVWYMIAYSLEKNLGKAYNEAMNLIPDGDAACFTDGDSMFLNSDFGHIIHRYANENPNAVLTCYLNRIHPLATGQQSQFSSVDVAACISVALDHAKITTVTPITGTVSGTLLVVPKHIWEKQPFPEQNMYNPGQPNILGVDNYFTNRVRAAGIQVLRMDGLFIYHQYRLLSNSKEHLL